MIHNVANLLFYLLSMISHFFGNKIPILDERIILSRYIQLNKQLRQNDETKNIETIQVLESFNEPIVLEVPDNEPREVYISIFSDEEGNTILDFLQSSIEKHILIQGCYQQYRCKERHRLFNANKNLKKSVRFT